MIKPYLLPILLSLSYAGGILAPDSNRENLFISSTQARVIAISATTGFMVANTLMTSQPKLLVHLATRSTFSSLAGGVAGSVVGGLRFSYRV